MQSDNLKAKGVISDNAGNKLLEFDVPSSLYEVPLNRYVDFLVEVGKATPETAIVQHAKAVSSFYGVDLMVVFNGVYDSDKEKADFEMTTVSQLHGYAASLIDKHITAAMNSPKVNVNTPHFEFKGKTFVIPQILTSVLSNGEPNLPGLTVIEAIEAMEANRLFETQKADDEDGSLMFTKYLTLLAVLCRIEGEHLPVDEVEREQFINERIAFFGSGEMISAGLAIDIDFFLTPFTGRYSKNNPLASFLYLQSLRIAAVVTLKRKPMRKPLQKTTGNKYLNGLGGGHLSRRSSKRATLRADKKQK